MTGRRGVVAVGAGSRWDARRNTSRAQPVALGAHRAAVEALARWRAGNPAHAAWVEQGAPTLTEAEHVARFGSAWRRHR